MKSSMLKNLLLAGMLTIGCAGCSPSADELFDKGVRCNKEKNYTEAAKYFHQAAERGHAPAQYRLAFCYLRGEGVKEDHEQAVKWLRTSAEQGYVNAQYELGDRYKRGSSNLGIGKDPEQSEAWFSKAASGFRRDAERGDAEAQYRLGNCYFRGQGVPKDPEQAVKWYTKAAEQGYVNAQTWLGMWYAWGPNGKPIDMKKAIYWYGKAAEQGDVVAKSMLVDLKNGE